MLWVIMPQRSSERDSKYHSTPLITTETLIDELLAVNAAATALCGALTVDQLFSRPDPSKWSIAENLLHLCTTLQVFLPTFEHGIVETRRRGFLSPGPFRLGRYGSLLLWYVEPPPVIRLPAPKPLVPQLAGRTDLVLERFLASQATVKSLIADASDLDLTKLRFPSPLARFIRMNLLEAFSVGNGHSRRHIWQAARVRQRLVS